MLWRYYQNLQKMVKPKKVLIVCGPRRVGKTTLLENFLSKTKLKYRLDSGDNIRIQQLLSSQDFRQIIDYAKGYELIAIDEAQEIPNIGKALKIIVDQLPKVQVIVVGSFSYDLTQSVGEPLTGRKRTLILFPLAQIELNHDWNQFDLKNRLAEFLIFGSYPEVILAPTKKEKIALLRELIDSYLLKDILAHEKLKGSQVLLNLVKLLAFQVGRLVSLNELATQLHIDVKTVGRYLDLLQKSFVIYKLTGFSKNLRNEVTSKSKYYFYDNGVRNAIISHFNDLNMRNDVGALWENFLMLERMKKQTYEEFYGERFFWRIYEGQEIDLIESVNNNLFAFEFKWSSNKRMGALKKWSRNYPKTSYQLITQENYFPFILASSSP